MLPRILVLLFAATVVDAADFSRDIAPILLSECVSCHSAVKAKGGYRVHSYAALSTAGKSRQAPIVPGKPDESELFKRLVTHDEDDRMPQDDEPLTTNQISLFAEWIAAGATLDRGETNSLISLLIPRLSQPAPPEIYKRPAPILALAFTPDGARLAVSGYHEITLWDLAGNLQSRITNAPQRIQSIAFHPTITNLFAIAGGKPGRNGEVSIFRNGAFFTNLVQYSDELLSVAFNSTGDLLAAAGSDNSIRVFNSADWTSVVTIQQHADWVTSIAFSASGDKILSASRDRTSRLYDAHSGELETTYPEHSAALATAVFIGPDQAASAGRERSIHLWETREGKKKNEVSGAESEITELHATEKFLFAASADSKIRQYQVSDRKLIHTYSGHTAPVFAIGSSSQKLASGSFDGTVKIWNVEDGSLITTFTASPMASPSDKPSTDTP